MCSGSGIPHHDRPAEVTHGAPVTDDKERLAGSFDRAADDYDLARPDYPAALFDALVLAAGLRPGDRVLEIGAGTGKATLPLADRGLVITCLEPGPRLAAIARARLADHRGVTVVPSGFESWRPPDAARFRLVFAATAWHWLDPALRYRRAWELLVPAGHLAFWTAAHVLPDEGDAFFVELQDVYAEIGAALPGDAAPPRPGELPELDHEVRATGLFEPVLVEHFDWETTYDAEGYIRLLQTFSGHIVMSDDQRAVLFGAIRRRLADRPEGLLRRHWGAVLHVARALPG